MPGPGDPASKKRAIGEPVVAVRGGKGLDSQSKGTETRYLGTWNIGQNGYTISDFLVARRAEKRPRKAWTEIINVRDPQMSTNGRAFNKEPYHQRKEKQVKSLLRNKGERNTVDRRRSFSG